MQKNSQDNKEKAWFKQASLGIFIHWGIYSKGDYAESWSFKNGEISYEDYFKQASFFTAHKFNPEKWARIIAKAGADYAILTSKHHDGVCLFNSAFSPLLMSKISPCKKDVIKLYLEALAKYKIKKGLYFSLLDWTDERYRSVFTAGVAKDYQTNHLYSKPKDGKENLASWQAFLDNNKAQLKELLTNYEPLDLLWFDGEWERSATQWQSKDLNTFLRGLQPNIIINDRLPEYGDYRTYEKELPLKNLQEPWEFCMTINYSWGYRKNDKGYKTWRELIKIYLDVITLGGKLLLDITPRADGIIPRKQVKLLAKLGHFIKIHKEIIMNSLPGLDYRYYQGPSRLACDNKTLYLFVCAPQESIFIKGLDSVASKVLYRNKELSFTRYSGDIWEHKLGVMRVMLPKHAKYPIMIKVKFNEPVTFIPVE